MPLTQLVGAAALSLLSPADSARAARENAAVHTPAPAPAVAAAPFSADSIVVDKSERQLTLYRHGSPVRTYLVALGQQPVGDKVRRGDMRTPEGIFRIEARNPRSRYHLALRISYPDAAHAARARALGVSPGGDIMIHGLPKRQAWVGAAHRDFDWTEGCIAVTNAEIEEIWGAVPIGTPIHIKP
jgi:murein L,D-transpeptidase YafK